ncbi:MIB [Mytilus edulis]|uniref:MIB n=1 Tax=Mytilus edulis TaxID=6550 RepID=A0A8S3RYE4_MYTED|nr:MIB [Mytilus edulis]
MELKLRYDSSFEFKDDFKTETSNISPGETSTTGGFDDILQARPVTEEQDYYTYDLISTEIQDKPRVQGYLSHFVTFAGERITDRYAGENSSRVVLMSRTIIPSSTVSDMQKNKTRFKSSKKSWIPKEEKPLGTIVMVKTLRREVYVQWDQIEEKINLHDIRLESSQPCANREKEEGSRVIKILWTSEDKSYVGTIVKVNITRQTARVRWDKQPEEKVQLYKLRVIGNYLTGVKHMNVTCDECYTYPLRGIRWKCLHCDSYDLCTVCYMADEHKISHIFSRIQSEDSKGKELPARFDVKLTGYAFALGIQENAEVSLRKDNRKKW